MWGPNPSISWPAVLLSGLESEALLWAEYQNLLERQAKQVESLLSKPKPEKELRPGQASFQERPTLRFPPECGFLTLA